MSLYSLHAVRQVYGSRTVLNVADLTLEPGQIFALVGPSGAGKSTLLRLLAFLEKPSSGSLTLSLAGRTIHYATLSIAERRQMGMVFQKPILLSRSVRANLAYALNVRGTHTNGEHARLGSRIDKVLQRVALSDLAHVHARTLSGGEAQRVALARVLVLEPRILLLDEPTANLDPGNVTLIESLIREQNEQHGTTVIMVTHNIFQARRLAHRVGFMLQGELIEAAPVESFFNAPHDPRTADFVSGGLIC